MRFTWTKELCIEEVKKYKTRTEFQKLNGSAYNAALRNNWIDEICPRPVIKPNGYWNLERCRLEMEKYKSVNKLNLKGGGAARWLRDNGFRNEANEFYLKKGTGGVAKLNITKKLCFEKASLCKTRTEFAVKYKSYKDFSKKHGFHKECVAHIPIQASRQLRYIYAYEFKDLNYVYVGLTCNKNTRHNLHKEKGSVFKFISKHRIELPDPLYLTDLISVTEASEKEGYFLNRYIENGWNKINIANTGGVGAINKKAVTFEQCKTEAKKYSTKRLFATKGSLYYNNALSNDWLDIICEHMNSRKRVNYWTGEKLINEAKNYKNARDMYLKNGGAYSALCKLKLNKIVKYGCNINVARSPV